METVAKFEQDLQQMLQSLALRILLWLATPVIVGMGLSHVNCCLKFGHGSRLLRTLVF